MRPPYSSPRNAALTVVMQDGHRRRPERGQGLLRQRGEVGEARESVCFPSVLPNIPNEPISVSSPWNFNWFAMKPTTHKEPKGTCLVISPFNFPVFLGIGHFVRCAVFSFLQVLMKS